MQLSRADYKAIKHMNKDQMLKYLMRIYSRGYQAGKEAAQVQPNEK